MTGKLTASFILKLEDQLSGGLAKIEKQLAALGALGKKLGLGSLEDGVKTLNKGTNAAQKMAVSVNGIAQSSDRARNSLGRFVSSNQALDQGAASARRMAGAVSAIGNSAERAISSLSRMAGRVSQAGRRVGDRVGVIGAAVAGYSVLEPIKAYADQENALRHIAITQKKSGPSVEDEVARLNANLNHEALATGQNSKELAKAYNFLITTGMSAHEVDMLMPAHAQAATAYNISSDSMGQAVFALADTMKISHHDMPAALAAMAYAAKEGHFSVEDFSHFLPTVSASMGKLGMTGRGAADSTFAALETVRKSTGDAGSAATDFKDFLDYIVSPFGAKSFAHVGVDLPGMLRNAEKQGVNPLDAVLGKLMKITAGKSPVQTAQILGTAIHNQQARDAALALIRNPETFREMREKFGHVDRKTIDTDFETAFRAPAVQVRIFNEQLEQLNRRLGQGFSPVMIQVNRALGGLLEGMSWLDKRVPGISDKLLAFAAGFLILVGVLGALSVVWGPLVAGFELLGVLLSPIMLALAAFALAAYDIYENWSTFQPFFQEMWNGVKQIFRGAQDFVMGWIDGDWMRAELGLEEVWDGVELFFDGAWNVVRQLFTDFGNWVDSWTAGAWTAAIEGIRKPFEDLENYIKQSALGRLMGLSGTPAIAIPGAGHQDGDGSLWQNSQGAPSLGNTTMTIGLQPGLQIVQQPALPGMNFNFAPISPLGGPMNGRVLGRP